MTTVECLLEATKEIWESYNEHPFVKGIEDGTLDKEKFRYYIIQDFLYLEDYAKSFAIGIAKAKSIETTQIFSGYINLLTGSEMNIHHALLPGRDRFPDLQTGSRSILATVRANQKCVGLVGTASDNRENP